MSDIARLRDILFNTLEGLQDKVNPLEIERAKVISTVAQTMINAAKVEVDYLDLMAEGATSPFFDGNDYQATASGSLKSIASVPGGSVTTHRLR